LEPINAGKPTEYLLLKEILLYEGSAVLWGANPNTPTISVGKSLTKDEADTELEKLTEELSLLTKSMKDGRYTDSSFELIELRMNQVNEQMKQLLNSVFTQPGIVPVEPEMNEKTLYDEIQLLTIKHFV
jgi:hypothetical protein